MKSVLWWVNVKIGKIILQDNTFPETLNILTLNIGENISLAYSIKWPYSFHIEN